MTDDHSYTCKWSGNVMSRPCEVSRCPAHTSNYEFHVEGGNNCFYATHGVVTQRRLRELTERGPRDFVVHVQEQQEHLGYCIALREALRDIEEEDVQVHCTACGSPVPCSSATICGDRDNSAIEYLEEYSIRLTPLNKARFWRFLLSKPAKAVELLGEEVSEVFELIPARLVNQQHLFYMENYNEQCLTAG